MGDSTICRGHLRGVSLHPGQSTNGDNARGTSVEQGNQPKFHGQHRLGKSDQVFHYGANGLKQQSGSERPHQVSSREGDAAR